jgi:hypothetical protein
MAAQGWQNYGLLPRLSEAPPFSFDGGTGEFTIVHPGDAIGDPGTATTVATWVLNNTLGVPAPRRPTFEMALFAVPDVSPPNTEIVVSLTDSVAVQSVGSYGLSGGMVLVSTTSNSALAYGRIAGGAWSRSSSSNRTTSSVVLNGLRAANGAVGMRSFLADASNDPIGTAGSSVSPTYLWGLGSGGPDVTHLHITVTGPACTITGYLLVAPTILGAPTP